jgi:class 3 adenylate cyclase/predicted ATPase
MNEGERRTFEENLHQVLELLQRRGRVTYRALKRQFELDDEYLEDLKIEIIKGQRLAIDEDGEVLVWAGEQTPAAASPANTETSASDSSTPSTTKVLPHAERRHLTVLFCDLVGSTALSAQLDPEDLHEILHSYQTVCHEVVRRYDGHLAQYLGDGLLVYFGYPHAHEDDPQRAVLAARGMMDAMAQLGGDPQREKRIQLALRIGIHTGLVVVGAVGATGRQEQLAVGDTPNVAAKIQSLAQPNTVVVSEATHRLVQGYFRSHPLGPQQIKGLPAAVHLFQILDKSGARTRLDIAESARLTPFVGHKTELTLLIERWELSQQGRGQLVLICGEVGIGKSRLIKALQGRVVSDGAVTVEFHCSPYYSNSAFYPITAYLEKQLAFDSEDTSAIQLDKLESYLSTYKLPLNEAMPLMASLLALPHPSRYAPLDLTPEQQKRRTQALIVAWLFEQANQHPSLVVWEDLHWADPSTIELLGLIAEYAESKRFCMLVTHRPEFRHPWRMGSHLTQLFLNRLTSAEVTCMVEGLTDGTRLPRAVVDQIIVRTDGVPLFVEEVIKLILESEVSGAIPSVAIPATLRDSLMARLDNMSTARTLAQLGATIGREFSYDLIQAVADLNDDVLHEQLDRLTRADLLRVEGLPPQIRYVFKHALIQEVAYASLVKRDRQRYHERIAQTLEKRFPQMAEIRPGLLARHYTEAGLADAAIPYWGKAGDQSIRLSAHSEAIAHLTKGLQLLTHLPDAPEQSSREILFQIRLGTSLAATKGYCAEGVEQAYARALALSEHLGDRSHRFEALYGLWRLHMLKAEYGTARTQGHELLALSEGMEDPRFLVTAARSIGASLFYMGDFAGSRASTDQACAAVAALQAPDELWLDMYDVVDPRVTCLSYASWTSWMLGYPDRARKESEEAIALAHKAAHPFSLALALSFSAWLHQFFDDVELTQERAQNALALSTEQGFQFWVGWEEVLIGWTLARQGDGSEGVERIRQGLIDWQATGSQLGRSYFLTLQAEAHGHAGQIEEALNLLAEAKTFTNQTQERWWEAEQSRLKGKLLFDRGEETNAEACFHHALELARRQQAKSLELRAAMSLARLWQGQGAGDKARQLLADVYGWFTEGFGSADLRSAKEMLETLGDSVPPNLAGRSRSH